MSSGHQVLLAFGNCSRLRGRKRLAAEIPCLVAPEPATRTIYGTAIVRSTTGINRTDNMGKAVRQLINDN